MQRRSVQRGMVAAVLAAVASTALGVGPASATVITRETQEFTADAYGDVIAWSGYDPAVGAFRLKIRQGETVTTPALATRQIPFDVSLGPGPDGHVNAVYSRCAHGGLTDEESLLNLDQIDLTGCDLYRYDVRTGQETRITATASAADETHPSIDGDRVAFDRSVGHDPRHGHVYIGNVTGPAHSVRQPDGPSNSADNGHGGDVRLVDGQLLFTWFDRGPYDFGRETLFRVRGKRLIPLYAATSGGANSAQIAGVAYSNRRVTFARTNDGSSVGNRIYRMTLGGAEKSELIGSSAIRSVSVAGGRLVLAEGIPGCTHNSNDPAIHCTLNTQKDGPFKAVERLR